MASSSDPKVSVTTQTGSDKENPIEQLNSDCAVSDDAFLEREVSRRLLQQYERLYLSPSEIESNDRLNSVQNDDRSMKDKPRTIIHNKFLGWIPKSYEFAARPEVSVQVTNLTTNNCIDAKETTIQRKIEQLQCMLQRVEHWKSREIPMALKIEGEKIKEEINRLIEMTSVEKHEKKSVGLSISNESKIKLNNKRTVIAKNAGNKKDKQYQRTIIGLKAEVQRQKAICARDKIKWEREREELQRALRDRELKKNPTDESSTQTSTDLESKVEVFESLAEKWAKLCNCNSCTVKNEAKLDKHNFNEETIAKKTAEFICDVCKEEFSMRLDYVAHNAISHGILLPKTVKDDQQGLRKIPAARGKTVGIEERRKIVVNGERKKCAEYVKINTQSLKRRGDKQVARRDAEVMSLEVVVEALQDILNINKPIVKMSSSVEAKRLDEEMTTTENEETLQDSTRMDGQALVEKIDEQVVVADAAATNSEVIIAETLRISKPIELIASVEQNEVDERITTTEHEESLQDSLNLSEPDDVSTETLPAPPIILEKETQTKEDIPKINPISAHKKRILRRRFMSQLFRHECDKCECPVVAMRSYAVHVDFCTKSDDCNLFVCLLIRDRSKHLRICDDELRCATCQYRIYFDEDRLQDMMEQLEKNCPIVTCDISNFEDKETLVYEMVQLAVNYGLIWYAYRNRNTETGEVDGIYGDKSSSEDEEGNSDGWELCG